MNKKYAVVLSGCGAKDGAEIHESVSALIAISKAGNTYQIFAPNINQKHVVNHITDEEMTEQRNVMVEAARIARGDIKPLEELNVNDFDALVLPGGFGAAKNLFTLAFDGLDFKVLPEMERIILDFHKNKKPIGAMCISPVLISKILGSYGVTLTFGPENPMAQDVENKFGAKVVVIGRDEALLDAQNKVVSTPCYMYGDSNIAQIAQGAENMVAKIDNI